MLKTARWIFNKKSSNGKCLSFDEFSETLTEIFQDKETVQAYLDLIFAKSYTFGLMDFLNMIEILEQEQFYKDAFELTFQIDSKLDRVCMIKFWKRWLRDMDNGFLCCKFIKEKIQKFNMPSYDVADFFEQIEE